MPATLRSNGLKLTIRNETRQHRFPFRYFNEKQIEGKKKISSNSHPRSLPPSPPLSLSSSSRYGAQRQSARIVLPPPVLHHRRRSDRCAGAEQRPLPARFGLLLRRGRPGAVPPLGALGRRVAAAGAGEEEAGEAEEVRDAGAGAGREEGGGLLFLLQGEEGAPGIGWLFPFAQPVLRLFEEVAVAWSRRKCWTRFYSACYHCSCWRRCCPEDYALHAAK